VYNTCYYSVRTIISLRTNYNPVLILTDIESAGFLLFESKERNDLSHFYKYVYYRL